MLKALVLHVITDADATRN